MDNLQIIRSPKGEEMVVVPRKEYEQLARRARDEDARDAALANAQLKKMKGGMAMIPDSVVKAIAIDGKHPVRVWRVHRGMTAETLAKKAGLTRTTITQIETRRRHGTAAAYKAIAKALGASIDGLMD